jgi:hypothetical protein
MHDLILPEGSHLFLRGVMTLWVFSAAVGAMGQPDGKSGRGYEWLYRFLHLLAANLDRAGLFPNPAIEETNEPITK